MSLKSLIVSSVAQNKAILNLNISKDMYYYNYYYSG